MRFNQVIALVRFDHEEMGECFSYETMDQRKKARANDKV